MASDHMHGMEADRLLGWILDDMKQGSALGIVEDLFFTPTPADSFTMERYGVTLETPLGVAAGPHTQLAQNIIAAWLCGARYIELKTVQVLDEISVAKPCIDMADEGYNCEWSQELRLDHSYEEYLKAWVIIHVLHAYRGGRGRPGMIFNMSAGYSIEGILSPTVQRFLDRMQNCAEDVEAMKKKLAGVWPRAAEVEIPGCMSDNLTISCMHGCPPAEVERIALYFLRERKLNTTLKMNPTLLGAETLRGLLNDTLGYEIVVPDIAFEHDLPYDDALSILRNCLAAAEAGGLRFSVKLTNTLESVNSGRALPEKESMVYMSGRALHPLSMALAERLQKEFRGELDISFCAGVDAVNVADVLACGLSPVTVCSDLLKPGGYGRLAQYLENIKEAMAGAGAKNLEDFARAKAGLQEHADAVVRNLEVYVRSIAVPASRYAKKAVRHSNVKTERALPALDCAAAPCVSRCPAGQDVPAYLERIASGDPDGALAVILRDNLFPNTLGAMCNQACREKCMRVQYDDALQIRSMKCFAASSGASRLAPAPANGRRVAVVGAGPSGLTCAGRLALAGCEVEVFEAEEKPGGRLIRSLKKGADLAAKDMEAILALGVRLHCASRIDQAGLDELAASRHAVCLAAGEEAGLAIRAVNVVSCSGEEKGGASASSLVASVGRGNRAATALLTALGLVPDPAGAVDCAAGRVTDIAALRRKQAFRLYSESGRDTLLSEAGARREASRCLQCDRYCGICVSVCPNRANLLLRSVPRSWPVQSAKSDGGAVCISTLATQRMRQTWQVVNIGDFCNECGNCAAFCPSAGAPYKDKLRLHLGRASFEADENGVYCEGGGRFTGKRKGSPWSLRLADGAATYEDARCSAVLDAETLEARQVELKGGAGEVSLLPAVEAAIFCALVASNPAVAAARAGR